MKAHSLAGKRGPTLLFFALSFAIAALAFILYAAATSLAVQLSMLLLGSFAPAFGAMVTLALLRDPVETGAFRQRLRTWRTAVKWYLVALLLPTVIWLLAILLMRASRQPATIQTLVLTSFPLVFFANLGEEIGWRGFALPRLLQHYSPLTASLGLGAIWGAFHIPVYYQRPLFAFLTFALLMAISVILTWLFLNTNGSVLLCTLFHATFNTWGQAFLGAQDSRLLYVLVVLLAWLAAAYIFFTRLFPLKITNLRT